MKLNQKIDKLEECKEKVVAEWFNTSINSINERILMLEYLHFNEIKNFLQQTKAKVLEIGNPRKIANIASSINMDSNTNNIILLVKHKLLMEDIKDISKEIVYLKIKNHNHLNRLLTFKEDMHIETGLLNSMHPNVLYIGKRNPLLGVYPKNSKIIRELFYPIFKGYFYSTLIAKNTSYGDNLVNEIIGDIDLFETESIILSRLACVMYRISTLNFAATTTMIGIFFSKEFGVTSKPINIKPKGIQNMRGFVLQSKSPIENFREDITQRLLSRLNTPLTMEIIASVTEQSLHDVHAISQKSMPMVSEL